MSDNEEFQEQLLQEAEEKRRLAKIKTRVDEDGTVFEWDEEKRAWFPKVDEDFLAEYQMNYGNDPSTELYRQRQKEWADYYANLQQSAAAEGESGGESGGGADGTTTEIDPTVAQEKMQEYYNSKEYREWYEKYVATNNTNSDDNNSEVKKDDEKPPTTAAADEEGAGDHPQSEEATVKKRKKSSRPPPAWYQMDDDHNTHVYIRGLPLDITDEEFEELMKKCGMIMHEPFTNRKRMKLYRDANGKVQGDGRCCYIKVESVDLALNILDGMDYRGHVLSVERAKFELKGEFDPSKRRRLTPKEKKKLKEHEENLFRWGCDANRFVRAKREKTLVLKHVFTLQDIMSDPMNVIAIKEKVHQECSQCGEVKKVVVHENHPEGVVTVMFSTAEEADVALPYLNGRILWYGNNSSGSANKPLEVSVWDGKTRYDAEETEEMKTVRLSRWKEFIQDDANEIQSRIVEEVSSSSAADDDHAIPVVDESHSSTRANAVVSEQLQQEEEDEEAAATPPEMNGDSPTPLEENEEALTE